MKRYIGLLFFSFILFTACRNRDSNVKGTSNLFEKVGREIKILVVIPIEGCTGCISEVTQYLLNNPPNEIKDCAVVFTNIRDRKGVRILLKPISNLPLVIIDYENKYYDTNSEFVNYPVVYEKSEKIVKMRKYEAKDSIIFIKR